MSVSNYALRVFGSPALLYKGEPVPEIGGKLFGLFVYLRFARGAVERVRLATLLWPEAKPERARKNCDKAIERLRAWTTPDLVVSAGSGKVQCRSDLGCDSDVLDVRPASLEAALAVLSDTPHEFLEGISIDSTEWQNWVGRKENFFSVRRTSIWNQALDWAIEQGNWHAVDILGEILFSHPAVYETEPHIKLIRGLFSSNRSAGALDHIERFISYREREDVGIPTEVIQLRTAIRTSQSSKVKLDLHTYDWDVFLAAPMAAVVFDYEAHRLAAMELVRGIERLGARRIFYAGIDRHTPGDFEEESAALALNHRALRRSRVFVMLHPAQMQTSTLIEAGIALELGIPFFLFARDFNDLPYLLKGRNIPNLIASPYRTPNDVISCLERHRRMLLGTAGVG
jgi:DNA-binding SARP family transcriptional activator